MRMVTPDVSDVLDSPIGVYVLRSVRENVYNNSKKRKKSCFLDFQKKRKKRTYNFYGCLMFIVPLHCCQNLTAQRSHSMFSNGSEWITLADLGTELQ